MWEKIEQGIITSYPNRRKPRICNVLQVPDGYLIRNVRLPQSLGLQTKPSVNSLVFIIRADDYQSYILSVIRDPATFLDNSPQGVKGSKEEENDLFPEGEIVLESRGDPSSPIAGTGSMLHLANDGTINLHSGKRKESIIIGGTDDDDDGEIVITADNAFLESNVNNISFIQSRFSFDEDNTITIGNFRQTIPSSGLPSSITELTVNEIILDSSGELSILNKDLLGLEKNNLTMSSLGTTSLDADLSITMDSLSINLNSGVFGAARLNDTTVSTIAEDPTWWAFWSNLSAAISALPTTPLDGGTTLKAGLASLFATIPLTITGRISTASTSVKVGG